MNRRYFAVLLVMACVLALMMPVTQAQSSCSSGTNKPATIYFINSSATDVNIFWNNFDCKEQQYGSLAGSRSIAAFLPQKTFDGHEWIVRDSAGKELTRITGHEGFTRYVYLSDTNLNGGVTARVLEDAYFSNHDQAMATGYALLWNRSVFLAYNAFSQAIAFNPSAAWAYAARAELMVSIGGGDFALASADAQAALKIDSNSAHATGVLALAQYQLGDKKAGLATAFKAVEMAPDEHNGYHWKAQVLQTDGQFDAALQAINAGIERFPDLGYLYYRRGAIFYTQGEYEKAIADITEAYTKDSGLAVSLYLRGLAQRNLENYEAAIADFNAFVAAGGDGWARTYIQRGWAYWRMGNVTKALADYETARSLDSNLPGPYADVGVIYRDGRKDYQKALAYFNKELTLSPNSATTVNQRGYTYLLMKDYDKAVADFDRSIELNPNLSFVHYNRFTAMLNRSNQAEAKASYCAYLKVGGKATKAGATFLDKAGVC
jgi:tetratricopeptide (TPR) repeat protein